LLRFQRHDSLSGELFQKLGVFLLQLADFAGGTRQLGRDASELKLGFGIGLSDVVELLVCRLYPLVDLAPDGGAPDAI
jgi:hypothetical protein